MNQVSYNINMNYNNQMNYNQFCPSMPYNQFNNFNPNYNFYGNNNFNGNCYQPINYLNPNFMNNQNINNLNNYNQINQNNNKIENSIDKNEILKILKNAQFKLAGFSLAKIKSDKYKKDEMENNERNRCGSPYYMAPELFLMETIMRTVESQKVDIWALGVVLFEMFFGIKPFEASSIEELSEKYRKREYYLNLKGPNKIISKEFIEFLNICLQEIPKDRADVYCLQRIDYYNTDFMYLELLNENELSSSLGSPERDEQNNIILRIDEKYFE